LTTTIAPSLGHGALFTQQGPGTTPGYDAIDDRRACGDGLQEGVLAAGDFMVTQRASSANMSVDIASGSARVQGDTVTEQGLYRAGPHAGVINEVIAAASGSPRVDQVILEVQDNVHDGSAGNEARVRVLQGGPTAGATLANRAGVAALPANALLLADVLVGVGAVSITNAVIRDRRKWARGACRVITRNQNAAAGNSYTTTSLSPVAIDATNLNPRIECSGAPVRITLRGIGAHSQADAQWGLQLRIDGVQITDQEYRLLSRGAGTNNAFDLSWVTTPAAGSHLFAPYYYAGSASGTVTLNAQAGFALEFVVEEIIRQNTANNTTTTG
jgi:hypothetical protein